MTRNRNVTYAEFRRRKVKRARINAPCRDINEATKDHRVDERGILGYIEHIAAYYGLAVVPAPSVVGDEFASKLQSEERPDA